MIIILLILVLEMMDDDYKLIENIDDNEYLRNF
jgi:hypothetical protein